MVVRTAYADDEATDAAQWSTALAKLQELTLRSENNPLLDSHKFALPVIADPALKGASYDTVRTAFNAWVNHYEEERMWQSDVRRDCCLVPIGNGARLLFYGKRFPELIHPSFREVVSNV